MGRRHVALLAALPLAAALGTSAPAQAAPAAPLWPAAPAAPLWPAAPHLVLAGRVVAIDPGHELGNSRHPAQVGRRVDAGGFGKACNTSGTATDDGFAESTFTMATADALAARLRRLGARVYLTRTRDSARLWGPCIDVRGRFGARVHADVEISLHGDGAPRSRHGFFVIRPADRRGWTDDIYARSQVLGNDVRAGLDAARVPRANYYGGDGLDTRGDLGTLNWSDVPIVMVELGNMHNPVDAAHMRSASYRSRTYAGGLARGLTAFLLRR